MTTLAAVVVVMACSYGVGQCGAGGNGDDLTRPQDLHAARVYANCMNSDRQGGMAELSNQCARIAHISHIVEYTKGPLVYIKTGKRGHVRLLHKQ